jgi:hypothetical protein
MEEAGESIFWVSGYPVINPVMGLPCILEGLEKTAEKHIAMRSYCHE